MHFTSQDKKHFLVDMNRILECLASPVVLRFHVFIGSKAETVRFQKVFLVEACLLD